MPVRDVVINILGRDELSPALSRAAASSETAAARISRAGDKVGTAGRKMTHAITLPVIALGVAAVKSATDFNSSMTRIQTQAGASARDVRILSRDVLAMRNVQQGPVDLANALYHLKSVGMGNVAAMRALRQASDLAAVGHANLEETTNALAGAWRTGIAGAKNFHQAVSTIDAVIGAGNMTLEDFTGALGTGILPTAKTFGLTLKDVGSALALFTDESVPADAAATRLRMTFSLLGAPSGRAEKQLKTIGLTGLTLANDMRKPNGLIRAVGDLKAHLEDPKFHLSLSQQAQLLSRAFGGGRSSSAILSLVNNFDVLRRKQDQVTRSLGKYNQAVKTQQATPEAVFKERIATLERTLTVTGTKLLPFAVELVTDIGNIFGKVGSAFDDMSSGQKRLVTEAGLAVIALGPVLSIVGRLGKVAAGVARAGAFMLAPYKQTAAGAELAALRVQAADLSIQAAEERSAAVTSVAEAEKARVTAEAQVQIAASLEGTSSVLAAEASGAALASIDFAAAMQAEADAAVASAAEITVAAEKAEASLLTMAANTKRSVFGMQSAIAGLGIGSTVGAFTRHASTSNKLLGALGSTAGGAAIGFSMGGPIGAAIGGLAGGLSDLAVAFIGTGDKASEASKLAVLSLQAQKQAADDLTGALKGVNGAYSYQYKQQLAQELDKRGVLAAGVQIGVSPKTVLQAATGNGAAITKFLTTLTSSKLPDKQIQRVIAAFAGISRGAANAESAFERQKAALQGYSAATRPVDNSLKGLRREFGALGEPVRQLTSDYVKASERQTASGRRATAIIRDHILAINNDAAAQVRHHKSSDQVASAVEHQVSALHDNLVALGFNDDAVTRLIVKYTHLPRRVVTDLQRKGVLAADIQKIVDKYRQVPRKVVTTFDANIDAAVGKINRLHQAILSSGGFVVSGSGVHAQAAGTMAAFGQATIPPNTRFTVGERGWEGGVTDSQGRASIYSNEQSRAMGFQTPKAYANGTGPTARPAVHVRVFLGDRELTDMVRVEVEDALSFDAGRARAHRS